MWFILLDQSARAIKNKHCTGFVSSPLWFFTPFPLHHNTCTTHTYLAPTSPQFVSQPSNVTVAPAANTTLECSVTGSPTPSISWYKDGLQLMPDSRRQQQSSGSLLISNVQNSDIGRYHCIATNTAGSIQSLTAVLQVACKWVSSGIPVSSRSMASFKQGSKRGVNLLRQLLLWTPVGLVIMSRLKGGPVF